MQRLISSKLAIVRRTLLAPRYVKRCWLSTNGPTKTPDKEVLSSINSLLSHLNGEETDKKSVFEDNLEHLYELPQEQLMKVLSEVADGELDIEDILLGQWTVDGPAPASGFDGLQRILTKKRTQESSLPNEQSVLPDSVLETLRALEQNTPQAELKEALDLLEAVESDEIMFSRQMQEARVVIAEATSTIMDRVLESPVGEMNSIAEFLSLATGNAMADRVFAAARNELACSQPTIAGKTETRLEDRQQLQQLVEEFYPDNFPSDNAWLGRRVLALHTRDVLAQVADSLKSGQAVDKEELRQAMAEIIEEADNQRQNNFEELVTKYETELSQASSPSEETKQMEAAVLESLKLDTHIRRWLEDFGFGINEAEEFSDDEEEVDSSLSDDEEEDEDEDEDIEDDFDEEEELFEDSREGKGVVGIGDVHEDLFENENFRTKESDSLFDDFFAEEKTEDDLLADYKQLKELRAQHPPENALSTESDPFLKIGKDADRPELSSDELRQRFDPLDYQDSEYLDDEHQRTIRNPNDVVVPPSFRLLPTEDEEEIEIERKRMAILPQNPPRKVDEHGRAYGTGRRKNSSARVWISEGSGKILVNGKPLHEFFPQQAHKNSVLEPLLVSERIGKFDVSCTVKGGGITGQAEAIRLGVARAIQSYEPVLRWPMKWHGLLTRDAREVEPKKAGQKKARKKFQWVKR